MGSVGHALVKTDPLEPAEALLVLGGDWKGERIMKACELARSGVAPRVLVSGPMNLYGRNEADLAIDFAVQRGCPQSLLEPVRIRASSTEEESREFRRELMARKLRRVLIVTSNYHSARARRIFRRRMANDVEIRMYAAPDVMFNPGTWWQSREGQKTVVYEWSKAISGAVGL
jgi:uncharacterized SAM-binding protein YcdF (DUF218 family)